MLLDPHKVSQETDMMVWYSHLSKSFPQFVMVYVFLKSEVYVFLKSPCFLYNPENVGIGSLVPLHGSLPCPGKWAWVTQWSYEPCHVGLPMKKGHSREFWQNMIHWRREWQTTPVHLPWGPHELYKRPKLIISLLWTKHYSG